MLDAFTLPDEFFTRDLNMVGAYLDQASIYLSKHTGKSKEECREWTIAQIGATGRFPLTDPTVTYLESKTKGNRQQYTTTMQDYMRRISMDRQILAATLTTYAHPEDERSHLAEFIVGELTNRGINKKKALQAKAAGDELTGNIFNNRQNRNKIKCNSLSGAQGTKSSVLFNKTAHSTLTTTCRSATQNSNASTERFLASNRHYWSHDIAINNIVSVITLADMPLIAEAILTYHLAIPSVEFICAKIKASTDFYWRSETDTAKIHRFVSTLTELERAAYMYTGDLRSLADLNPELIKTLITGLAIVAEQPIENPKDYISQLQDDEMALLGLTCSHLLNYKKLWDDEVKEGPNYGIIGATAKQVLDTNIHFLTLYRAFLLTHSLPPSVAMFPSSVRKVVVASDTDSSIFTNQDWTKWYLGEISFTQRNDAISAAMTYLSVKVTAHALVVMSGNMGFAKEHLHSFIMKNEYAFKCFSLTSMAKHYYAIMIAQEGNVYKEPHWEIKGAQLKNSKAPSDIMKASDNLIKQIVNDTIEKGGVEAFPIIADIVTREKHVISEIRKGVPKYFSRATIKPAAAYKGGENSVYGHYLLWNEVFGPKYGITPEPPYAAIKVNIGMDTPNKVIQWLAGLTDRDLADRMTEFLRRTGKRGVNTLLLPTEIIEGSGIPEEIVDNIDIKSMVMSLMRSFYLILETLGIYMLNKNITRLLSDEYGHLVKDGIKEKG